MTLAVILLSLLDMSIENIENKTHKEDAVYTAQKLILSDEQYRAHPFAHNEDPHASYVFEITQGGTHLVFFGSPHTNQEGDSIFTDIQKAFEKEKPDKVYVEGMPSINSKKDEVRSIGKTMSLTDTIKHGENTYTLKLAIDAGVDFESPEPELKDEITYLEQHGYDKRDIFDFYISRQIFQYQREYSERSVLALSQYLAPYIEQVQKNSDLTHAECAEIIQTIFSEIDLDSDIYEKKTDPIFWEGNIRTKTNEISHDSSQFRDEYIVARIAEGLKKYDRVFIVYGAGHAVKQEPALRALMQ